MKIEPTIFVLYINNQPVHTCQDWFIAHGLQLNVNGIDEWYGLPIYTSINGVPSWGNTPEEQAKPLIQQRLTAIRATCLASAPPMTDEERERIAREKLAALVTELEAEHERNMKEYRRKEGKE